MALAEDERLGDQLRVAGDHQVQRQLQDARFLGAPDVEDIRPDVAQQVLHPAENVLLAGDHDPEVPGLHDRGIPAHGRTEIPDPGLCGGIGDLPRHGGRDRAHVYEHPALPARHQQPVGAGRHLEQGGVVEQHRHGHVPGLPGLPRRRQHARAGSGQLRRPFGGPVPDGERMARVEHPPRDRLAHLPQSEHGDLHATSHAFSECSVNLTPPRLPSRGG